jgi:D,D-heptose 1,7-bisphosphate phosphatase
MPAASLDCGMETFEADAVVIGAGVVGLACAAELARRGIDVLVVEKDTAIGSGISSRNSEVIHAGIYYPTGSLKHRLCVEGRRKLYAYLAERGVAHRVTSKLIVATTSSEEVAIDAIYARALANGVEGMRRLSGAEARKLEPELACVAAVESRETGILDTHGYMLALIADIESGGGAVALETKGVRLEILSDGRFSVETSGTAPARIVCRRLVNSAGLAAQSLAQALHGYTTPIPQLTLAKGSYFGCAGKAAFSRLIYPAPVDGGLGVHMTLDLAGRMRFGPDVEWLNGENPDAVDYDVAPARAQSFYAAIRRYWPDLPDGALSPDYAGCRPKLSAAGAAVADFRVDGPSYHGHPGLVHLFGIESPGLTASLAIAERVADEALGCGETRNSVRRAVFFDRDGTLNIDHGYTYRPEDLVWNEGAIDAVRAVNKAGWLAIVATNQSGIGRGLFDEAAMHRFHERMQEELARAGARIDAFYFCPFHPEAAAPAYRHPNHPDRKPNAGMLRRAIADFGIDRTRSLMIGDSEDDLSAARNAGVAGLSYRGGDLGAVIRSAMETSW